MRWTRAAVAAAWGMSLCVPGYSQQAMTFQDVVARFRANNPDLAAGQLLTEESKANEITAGLRPNPILSIVNDQDHFLGNPRPFGDAQLIPSFSYLIERQHKRQLRTESAKLSTSMAARGSDDLERNLLFTLRDSWNRALLAQSILDLATENLAYYDRVIDVNRARYQSGDISELDLQRVELQRVQFQSDVVNATASLRTAKIQLLALMNERTLPVNRFELKTDGEFEFRDMPVLLPEVRQAALESRPDLQQAETAVHKAQVDNKLAVANGAADPTVGFNYQRDSQFGTTMGLNVTVPLRIFDRNQGEKARTAIDIRRTERAADSIRNTIVRDVDSAYEQLQAARNLLIPYREKYLEQAKEVRERVSFAYSKGGASLLEFLDAQKTYRDTELAYRNLVGSWLTAVAQLNLAAGREVIR